MNPDDPDENGTYVYGVRHWSTRGAIASVVDRVTTDGYLIADDRAPKADKVAGDINWEVGSPLCYGKET